MRSANNAEIRKEFDQPRQDSLVRLGDLSQLQNYGKDQLLGLQRGLGFGETWGLIEFPKSYLPPGSAQRPSRQRIDLRGIPNQTDATQLAFMRLIWLRWLVPIGNASQPCTASTFYQWIRDLIKVYRVAISKPTKEKHIVWSRLSSKELYEIIPRTDRSNFGRVFETLQSRKLITDAVKVESKRRVDLLERSRKGLPGPQSNKKMVAPYLPLPDEFTSQFGWRCVWLIKNVGPMLIDLLETIYSQQSPRLDIGLDSARDQYNRQARDTIARHVWKDASGATIVALPFELNLKTQSGRKRSERAGAMPWPPTSVPDLWQFAQLLQTAQAFVVGLSGGPREGEILSQSQACLVESREGIRVLGRTYKLEFLEQGKVRDWPAPELTVFCVAQQVRLARLAQTVAKAFGFDTAGQQLWVMMPNKNIANAGKPLNSLEYGFKKLLNTFGLQPLLSGPSPRERNLHSHRLRKTTGRLVGLTLANAVHVLMDLFGHQDPEMTVAYLLSNKDIAREAQAVAKAQTIIFANTAIASASENGGPAAKGIEEQVIAYAKLRGKTRLDAKDIDSLARDLTEVGTYWELVRPGVICTKLPGEFGACTGTRGGADTSKCKSGCGRRLELAAEKANVDRTIARIVEHIDTAMSNNEPLLEQHWRGQLAANLNRFTDLKAKWSSHTLVAGRPNSGGDARGDPVEA